MTTITTRTQSTAHYNNAHAVAQSWHEFQKLQKARLEAAPYAFDVQNDLEYRVFYAENHEWAETENFAAHMGDTFDLLHLLMHGTPEQISDFFKSGEWEDWYDGNAEAALRELRELHRHPFYRSVIDETGWDGEWDEIINWLAGWPLHLEIWAFENYERLLLATDEEKIAILRSFTSEEDQLYLLAHSKLFPQFEHKDFIEEIIPGGWHTPAFLHAFLNGQMNDLRRRCAAMADAWDAFSAEVAA